MSAPRTAPLARAVADHRPRTTPLLRIRALCGLPTDTGDPCHLRARHDARCLPPPGQLRRPGDWGPR